MDLNAVCGEDIDIKVRYDFEDQTLSITTPSGEGCTFDNTSTFAEIVGGIRNFIEEMYYYEVRDNEKP